MTDACPACQHAWASHVDPGGCCVGDCPCLSDRMTAAPAGPEPRTDAAVGR